MKLQCVSTQDKDCSMSEYESLTVKGYYTGTLVKSTVEFSEKLNDHVHKSVFLVYNDKNEWREYPSYLFKPVSF